jgi:hypothetical protein
MRSAGEVVFRAADARQPGRNAFGVHRFAGMRGAGKRDFLLAEAKGFRRAGFDKRQGLDGFERGPRIDRRFDIAQREAEIALSTGDCDAAAVNAFHQWPARDFDEDRVGHAVYTQGSRTER